MEALKIVGLCVLAAVIYGVVHDQVTVRICLEYFTIGHPPTFDTESPTLLALGWGVLATFWMGLLLGVPMAVAARAGSRPKRDARALVRPIAVLLGVMAVAAAASGLLGFVLARQGGVVLVDPMASRVPADRHVAFLTALWAHSASYLVGALGGLVLIAKVWRSRRAAT